LKTKQHTIDPGILLQQIREILQQHDTRTFGQCKALNEYTSQAGRILLRLSTSKSANNIEAILNEVLVINASEPSNMINGIDKTVQLIKDAYESSNSENGHVSIGYPHQKCTNHNSNESEKKTVRQLVDETRWRHVSQEEFSAAREYERSLMPGDIQLPEVGQCYRCIEALEVTLIILFSMPGSASEFCTICRGTEVIIDELPDARPIEISFLPRDKALFLKHYSSQSDLANSNFSHFYLRTTTLSFLKKFEPCN
jgi:hypothetical protein